MEVLVARYYVKAGKGDEVEAALKRMTSLVHEQEPDCLFYQAHRWRENPDVFLLYEQYQDEAALETHRNTPYFKEIIETTVAPLLDNRVRERYDAI